MKKIYLLKDRLDGMEYIGQTCCSLQSRLGRGYKEGTKIREALDRDGIENFDKIVLEDGLTEEQADEREQYYIRTRNTLWPNGLNLQGGGKNSSTHPETRRRLSEVKLGHEVSEETRKKMSENRKGILSWNKGKKDIYSSETLKKMSKSHQGKITWNAKKVRQYTKDGQFIAEYLSTLAAEKQTGINQRHISAVCRGERKSAGSFLWEYV